MKNLIVSLLLCCACSAHAQSIYGTNIIYYNDDMSTNGGVTWTPLFAGTPHREEVITDTNMCRYYHAEHVWVTNTVNTTLAVLYVRYSDRMERLGTNLTSATGIFINHSLTNALFRPWVTITNIPFPPSTLVGCTNCVDTNGPPGP